MRNKSQRTGRSEEGNLKKNFKKLLLRGSGFLLLGDRSSFLVTSQEDRSREGLKFFHFICFFFLSQVIQAPLTLRNIILGKKSGGVDVFLWSWFCLKCIFCFCTIKRNRIKCFRLNKKQTRDKTIRATKEFCWKNAMFTQSE